MARLTADELARVLELHAQWLEDASKGQRADLRGADLRGADLYGADLRWAYLREADLRGADLREANLRRADLSEANLRGATLREADLSGADLYGADLRGADLREANLRRADLSGATFGNATPEEIARLDAVRAIVLDKPERLRMADWHTDTWTPEHTPEDEQTCDSAHCIAGWLQALSPDREVRQMDALDAGIKLAPTAAPLFYADDATVLQWFKDRDYASSEVA